MAILEAPLPNVAGPQSSETLVALPEIEEPLADFDELSAAFGRSLLLQAGATGPAQTWLARGRVKSGKNTVDWKLEVPEELTYDGIVMFVSGLGAPKHTSQAFGNAAAQAGYASLIYSPARHDTRSLSERFRDPQQLHVEALGNISGSLKAHSETIKKFLPGGSQIRLDKKLLAAHSMGGNSAPVYAKQKPETIDGIINLGATGFGSPTAGDIPKYFSPEGVGSVVRGLKCGLQSVDERGRQINLANIGHFARHVLFAPLQTGSEVINCTTDMLPTVVELRALKVFIGYIAFEYDRQVPPNPIIAEYVNDYQVMPDVDHWAPQDHPEKVVAEIDAMLKRRGT